MKKSTAAWLVLSVALLASVQAQTTTNRWTDGTGDWTNAANWSAAAAPIPSDLVFITNAGTSYTVTIDSGTTASTLTNFNLTVGNSGTSTTQTLSIVSAPIPLVVSSSLTNLLRGIISMTDSSLIVGTNFLNKGQLTMNGSGWTLSVPNSSTNSGGLSIGGLVGTMASFSGGSVILTNAANNATLTVGNNTIGTGNLFVTNALLRVSIYSQGTGRAYIDNSGVAATNLLRTVALNVVGDTAASLTLAGGIFDGTVTRVALGSGISGANVTATITNRGAVWNMSSGDVSIGNTAGMQGFFVQDGGTSRTARVGADTGELRIGSANNATGTLTVISGLMTADGDASVSGAGALAVGAIGGSVGTFNQYGGRVVITNSAALNNNATVRMGVAGKGFFNMTNGTMLADRFVLGTNAQQVAVGKDALIEIKQAAGFSNTAPFSIASSFDFDGTLKFSPVTATATQRLMLAGIDLGASTAGFTNDFSLGTLDLSAFGKTNRLQLLSPYSIASTALYVEVVSPIATNALISSFNVYYLAEQNATLFSGGVDGTYSLSGGGSLIPISLIPEPSPLLLGGGVLALLFTLRRRSK